MTQWTVRAIFAHNGVEAWDKEHIEAPNSDAALSSFLNDWMPNRPVTLLVWIIDEHNQDSVQVTIGLN